MRGGICIGCAAANLIDPHCASCVQLAMFCDVAIHVKDLEYAREDEATVKKSLWIDAGRHAFWLMAFSVMALSGVRNPLAYLAIVFGQVALFVALRPLLLSIMHKKTMARAARVLSDLDLSPDTIGPALGQRYLDERFIIERVRALYAQSEHAKICAQTMPDPVRGTDFDVPPPPLRPE